MDAKIQKYKENVQASTSWTLEGIQQEHGADRATS